MERACQECGIALPDGVAKLRRFCSPGCRYRAWVSGKRAGAADDRLEKFVAELIRIARQTQETGTGVMVSTALLDAAAVAGLRLPAPSDTGSIK